MTDRQRFRVVPKPSTPPPPATPPRPMSGAMTGSVSMPADRAWRLLWFLVRTLVRHPRSSLTVEFGYGAERMRKP